MIRNFDSIFKCLEKPEGKSYHGLYRFSDSNQNSLGLDNSPGKASTLMMTPSINNQNLDAAK